MNKHKLFVFITVIFCSLLEHFSANCSNFKSNYVDDENEFYTTLNSDNKHIITANSQNIFLNSVLNIENTLMINF